MTAPDPSTLVVGVVGAGTMGAGIAQVAAVAGHEVLLHDLDRDAAERAVTGIGTALDWLVEKGRLDPSARDSAVGRVRVVASVDELAPAGLVVEVVVERLDVKQALLASLESVVAPDAVLASNTSSLSITDIAAGLRHPERVVGLHFFNPAPVLPLVEVVSGERTSSEVASWAYELAGAWGKTPVRAASTPGFIVNRVARPFYGEAFRAYEEGVADPATIDALLREGGGFRMGPFELTDLIGHDVNTAVTRSVWSALDEDPRFAPSAAQEALVASGRLGRKSGAGWFSYGDGAVVPEPATEPPTAPPASVVVRGDGGRLDHLLRRLSAAVDVDRRERPGGHGAVELPSGAQLVTTTGRTATELARQLGAPVVVADLVGDPATATRIAIAAGDGTPRAVVAEAVGLLQACGLAVSVVADRPGLVVARTLALIIAMAADAVEAGVASEADVDLAMKDGVSYPHGPLEWAGTIGPRYVEELLRGLARSHPERYRVPQWIVNRT